MMSLKYLQAVTATMVGLTLHGCKPTSSSKGSNTTTAKKDDSAEKSDDSVEKSDDVSSEAFVATTTSKGIWKDNIYGEELRKHVKNQTAVDAYTTNPSPNPSGKKKALVIGVTYKKDNNDNNDLHGTFNDASVIRHKLKNSGWKDSEITFLTDGNQPTNAQVTKDNIINEMRNLVKDVERGDCLFFSFSGHGTQVYEGANGNEADGKDEAIIAGDGQKIIDDIIHDILVLNLPEGVKLTIVFDNCHSGTAIDMPFQYERKTKKFETNPNPIYVPADVVVISGSSAGNLSWESHKRRELQVKFNGHSGNANSWFRHTTVGEGGFDVITPEGVTAINEFIPEKADKLIPGVQYLTNKKYSNNFKHNVPFGYMSVYSLHGNLTNTLMDPNVPFLFHTNGWSFQQFINKCDEQFGFKDGEDVTDQKIVAQQVQITSSQLSAPDRIVNIDRNIMSNTNKKLGREMTQINPLRGNWNTPNRYNNNYRNNYTYQGYYR